MARTTEGRTAAAKRGRRGAARVRRRRVLYVHGFDPRGPGPYHAMFVEEADRAAAVGGVAVEVGPRRRGGEITAEWSVQAGDVSADYAFLRWDDRVRARWSKQEMVLLAQVASWTGRWGRLGYFALARRQARALWFAMISVPIAIVLYMISALVVVSVLGFAAGWAVHAVGLPFWVGAIPAVGSLFLAPAVWRRLEDKLNICWLSRCFTYMQGRAVGPAEDLVSRDQAFADLIRQAAADKAYDEVLVVGHSLGALHAISALSRALAADRTLGQDGRLAFMTLGQPVAIFTAQPEVEAFRRDLETFAAATQIPWLDVTSPSDPASACALDPFRDVSPPPAGRFLQRSPRFHLFLSPDRFRAIRRDPISFHFQYLRAPDKPGGFDYFAFVAGPERMMEHPWVKAAMAGGPS